MCSIPNTPPRVCEEGKDDRPAPDTHEVLKTAPPWPTIAPPFHTNQSYKADSFFLDAPGGAHAPASAPFSVGPDRSYRSATPESPRGAPRPPPSAPPPRLVVPVGMPTKARGYWFCEYCPASFDTADEAEEHERIDCLRNPNSTASSAFASDPPHDHPPYQPPLREPAAPLLSLPLPLPLPPSVMPPQLQPPPHYPYYDVPRHPGAPPPPPPPPHPAGAMGHPRAAAPPPPPPPPHPQPPPRGSPRAALRRFPLMDEPSRRSSPSRDFATRLVPGDLVACRHLELIETVDASSSPSPSALPPPSSSPPAASAAATQVGLRCQSCGDSTRINELSLPRAIRFLADAIRRLADQHLTTCPNLPTEERQVLEEACRRRRELHRRRDERQQRAESPLQQQERHASGEASPDAAAWRAYERDRQLLVDFCTSRCHEVGIVNKMPENSGIVFRNPSPASSAASSEDPYGGALMSSASSSSRHEAGARANARQPSPPGYPGHRPSPPATAGYPATSEGSVGHGPGSRGDDEIQHPRQQRPSPTSSADQAGYYHPLGPPPPASYPYEMVPSSFPFYHEVDGSWLCKFCSHVPPEYREASWRWSSPSGSPPPTDFIDHHLHLCRYYHQSLQRPPSPQVRSQDQASHHAYHQGRSMGDFGSPPPHVVYGQQPPPSYPSPHPPSQHLVAYPHPPPAWDPSFAPRRGSSPLAGPSSDLPSAPYMGAPEAMALHPTHRSTRMQNPRSEMTAQRAIEFLSSAERRTSGERGSSLEAVSEPDLVQNEDKLLLTDFLFHLMKQLQIVRFSESDRKTRGGKREKIQIGFGGLECIHCKDTLKSRKFFWSGVDRLANSFAEIPAHVFKCSSCPEDVKVALTNLKKVHAEQMARLPRGSQKVFFRRVWKRLHDQDPVTSSPEQQFGNQKSPPPGEPEFAAAPSPGQEAGSPGSKQQSPEGTSGSEESIFTIDRPTKDSAKVLADAAIHSLPPSPSSRVLLGIAEDRDFLSDVDCFLRRQLEVFCATKDDVRTALEDRKYPIKEGQVGIRCVHCALAHQETGASGHAVAYPFSITGIFEAVREFQRLHLDYCENLPAATRSKILAMKESTTITSIQRKYYALAARGLGLTDTKEGIRAGSEAVPVVSQAVFSFGHEASPDSSPRGGEGRRRLTLHEASWPPMEGVGQYDSESRKRRRQEGHDDEFKPPPGQGRGGSGEGPTNYEY